MCACHGPDFDVTNNKLSNLRWDTYENNRAEIRRPIGFAHPNSVINEEIARKVKTLLAGGKQPTEISRECNVHRSIVNSIKFGQCWKHVCTE
jgi:hypothetical protein